jgi:hypothetical protein
MTVSSKMRYRGLAAVSVACIFTAVELAAFATGCASSPREHAQTERSTTTVCPQRKGRISTNENRRAFNILVPRGAKSVLLCRYHGFNPAKPRTEALAGRLAHSKSIESERSVRRLADEFNALKPVHGTFACPADFGAEIAVFFHYRAGPDDIIKVELSGCGFVSNERIHHSFRQSTRLTRDLLRATASR